MKEKRQKTKLALAEYCGMSTGLKGEPLIWVNRVLMDGTMTTGIYNDKQDLLSQSEWELIEMDLLPELQFCQDDLWDDSEEPECLICGGDGYVDGQDYYDWQDYEFYYDPCAPCPSCGGSGLAKDMSFC